MKDLIEFILKNLTAYVGVLCSVTAAPKRSVAELIESEDCVENVLVFGCTTAALGLALQAPLLTAGQDFIVVAGSMFVVKILAILAFSSAVFWSFRIVGGRGDYRTTLCAYLYLICPLYLFFTLLDLIVLGLLSSDPAMAASWQAGWSLSQAQVDALMRDAPGTADVVGFLGVAMILSTPVWFGISWGALGAIHRVSAWRALLAFAVSGVLCWALFALSVQIMRGLHGGALPAIM